MLEIWGILSVMAKLVHPRIQHAIGMMSNYWSIAPKMAQQLHQKEIFLTILLPAKIKRDNILHLKD